MKKFSYILVLLQIIAYDISTAQSLIVDAGNNDTICLGDSTQLIAFESGGTPPYQYSWIPSCGLSNANIQNPMASPGSNTIYTLIVKDSGSVNMAFDYMTITVNPHPTANFSVSSLSECIPFVVNTTNLSNAIGTSWSTNYFWDVSFNNSYWSMSNNWSYASGSDSSSFEPDIIFSSGGSYTVTLNVTNNCGSVSYNQNIIAKDKPIVVLDPLQDTCSLALLQPVASFENCFGTTSSYNWQFPGGIPASSNLPIPGLISYSSYGPNLVSVSSTNECGTSSDTGSINIFIAPNAFAGQDDTICAGQTTIMVGAGSGGSGNFSYSWSNGVNTNLDTVSPIITTTYTLTVTDGSGCIGTDQVIVNVNSNLNVNFGNIPNLCDNDLPYQLIQGSPIGGTYSGAFVNSGYFYPDSAGFGQHIIKYEYSSGSSCADSAFITVTVNQAPTINFASINPVCEDTVPFYLTTGNPIGGTYSGTGISGITFNPSIAQEGTHPITYFYTDSNGCSNAEIQNIIVRPLPLSSFVHDSVICANTPYTFTNNSIGASSYLWDFGDGTIPSSNPNHTYLNAGIYNVTLYSYTQFSCNDSASSQIDVIDNAIANFSIVPNTGCAPLQVSFNNLSSGTGITSYFWDFGNAITSTLQNPGAVIYQHSINDTTYYVNLTVATACGSVTHFDSVSVLSNYTMAFFETYPTTGCIGDTFIFANSSIGGNVYSWKFGDSNTSSDKNPSHSYNSPGTYLIELVITGNDSCAVDTFSNTVTVRPLPEVNFSYIDSVCAYEPVYFIDSSQTILTNRIWDFGDDSPLSNVTNPQHYFLYPGTYIVTLTGFNAFGCSGTISKLVHVLSSPNASFYPSDTSGCVPFTINTFFNASTDANGYQWKFGDTNTSTLTNPSHTYINPGTYTVTLIASNFNNCFDTVQFSIEVFPNPTGQFSLSDTSSCGSQDPLYVHTINTSTGISLLDYNWDFGNNYTSDYKDDSTIYPNIGYYEIELIVTDKNQCTDTSYATYNAYPVPLSYISKTSEQGCEPLEVSFNVNSSYPTPNNLNYIWLFGDGDSSNIQNPIHIYQQDGKYNISLITTGNGGCADTISLSNAIDVFPKPLADFEPIDLNYTAPGNGAFQFIDNTIDGGETEWDFGDGYNSVETNPIHTYDNYGTYFVELISSNTFGCYDMISKEVNVVIKGLYIPNALSPGNPSEAVREFKPVGVGLKEYKIEIYNTWGNKIWESDKLINGKPAEGWDGYIDGKIMPRDVYVWKASGVFIDDSVWQGQAYPNGEVKPFGTVTLIL